MKYKFTFPALFLAAFFISGCVSAPIAKNILAFSVVPDKGIKAGTIITVNVKTTDDAAQVMGFLDLMPSYKIPLKYDVKQKIWYRREMVPMIYTIPPGKYTVKIEVTTKGGDRSFAEKEISTY